MKYLKKQFSSVLKSIVRPFNSFEDLSSLAVYPLPLVILFGALWLEAVRRNWFYYPLQTLHTMLLAKIVVIFGICIAFCVLAVLMMLIVNAIGGHISFARSVNVLGIGSLHYSLYFLLLIGVLMAIPVNTLDAFTRYKPNIIPFFYVNVYRGAIAYSVIRVLFGAVISAEQRQKEDL